MNFVQRMVAAVLAFVLAFASPALADELAVGVRRITLVDETRSIKPSGKFAGTPTRQLDLIVWYPAERDGGDAPLSRDGPWPLVIYSHGTFGRADNATHLVEDLARQGYVVVAPNHPLTSSAAFTRVEAPDISDVVNQTRDISFIVDRMLADAFFAPAIDRAKIGTMGHSLGAVTDYFVSYGGQTRDARIAATVLIGAGDPVQAALSTEMGLAGTWHVVSGVPALFLSAEKDIFARMTGGPYAAYARIGAPKYEAMIARGVHVWFRDGTEQPADGKNPDCLFFERMQPGVPIPGCEERTPLIAPARQQEITRAAVRTFFDAYLKRDAGALARLRGLDREFGEVSLRREDE